MKNTSLMILLILMTLMVFLVSGCTQEHKKFPEGHVMLFNLDNMSNSKFRIWLDENCKVINPSGHDPDPDMNITLTYPPFDHTIFRALDDKIWLCEGSIKKDRWFE